MGAAPYSLRAIPKLAGANKIARQDCVAAGFSREVPDDFSGSNRYIPQRAAIGPTYRSFFSWSSFGFGPYWLLIANLAHERLLGGAGVRVIPLAPPKLDDLRRRINVSFNEHRWGT
jgi:hypothetical protein